MKKTLLLFAMLLGVVGAWAAVTKPVSGVYVISGDNPAGKRGNLAAVEGITEHPALSKITWDTYKNNSATPITNGEYWYVYQVGDKYVIYNLGLKKYLFNPKNGNQIDFSDTPYLWDILVNSSNGNFNSIWDATGTYLCFGCGKNAPSRNVYFNNESHDGGSWHTFTAVDNGDNTYAEDIAVVVSKMNPTFTLTDIAGNEYTGTYSGIAGVDEPTFTGVANITISNKQWNGDNFTADITFPFPASKEVVISSFKGTKDPGLRKYYVGTGDNEGNVMYGPSNPPTDNKDKWIIEPSLNGTAFTFKIKNVGTGTYITTSATTTTDAKNTVTVTDAGTAFTVDADNRFKLPTTKSDGSALYLSAGSSTSNDQYLGAWTWNGNDGVHNGNCNYIYEVELPYEITDIAGNIFEGTLDASGASGDYPWISGAQLSNISFDGMKLNATVTFNIPVSDTEVTNPTLIINGASWDNTNSRKWRAVEDDGKLYVKVQKAEINYTDNNALWAIYPELNSNTFKFKIKSLSTGKFVKANPNCTGELNTDVTGNTKPVTLEDEGTAFEYKVRTGNNCHFTYVNAQGGEVKLSMNGRDDQNVFLGVYKGDHSGNDIAFPKYVENMNWPEFVSTGTTINPLVIAIDNDATKALVAKKLPSSADRYVHVTASNEEPELGYGQWTIYPAFSGNKIGFKIKNIATDTYIYAKPNGASEEYPVVLNAEGTAFDFADSKFAYTDGVNTLYLSVPTNESFNLPLGVSTEADDTRKTIAFPEFNSFQVTIGEVGYTTLYSPFTVVAIPEEGKEVDIYAITDATISENNKVTLTKLESWNLIPANQGCILKGSGKITFSKTDDDLVSGDWSTNLLCGSFTNTYVKGYAYVLSAPDGVESVGLYKAELNMNEAGVKVGKETGTHFLNNAGKAYLPKSALSPEASEARFFLFDFGGEETGITETENGNVETENSEVYDLAGRRVQNAQKGIFIVNGKKVIK